MAADTGQLGRIGEDAASAEYLARGFRIVARNWRCSLGEIDLIARRERLLVVCEVKTRRGSAFGGPFDAVTAVKQRRIRSLATAFVAELAPAATDGPDGFDVRFDVASVALDATGRPQVHLFEDAF